MRELHLCIGNPNWATVQIGAQVWDQWSKQGPRFGINGPDRGLGLGSMVQACQSNLVSATHQLWLALKQEKIGLILFFDEANIVVLNEGPQTDDFGHYPNLSPFFSVTLGQVRLVTPVLMAIAQSKIKPDNLKIGRCECTQYTIKYVQISLTYVEDNDLKVSLSVLRLNLSFCFLDTFN